jgi:hypothetical protein
VQELEQSHLYRLCYIWSIAVEPSGDPLVPMEVKKCVEEIVDTMVWRATSSWPPRYPSCAASLGDVLPKDAEEFDVHVKTCRECAAGDVSFCYCKDHVFSALVLGLPVVREQVAVVEDAKPANVSEGKVAVVEDAKLPDVSEGKVEGESDAAFRDRQKRRAYLLKVNPSTAYLEALRMGFTAEELSGVCKDKRALADYVFHKMASGAWWSAEKQASSDHDVSVMWERIVTNLRAAAASDVPYTWSSRVDETITAMKVNYIDPLYPSCLFGKGHGYLPKTFPELLEQTVGCYSCMAVKYDAKTRRKYCCAHEFGALCVGVSVFKA